VLANDYDVEGSPLTASLLTGPGYGDLAFYADGTLTYVPLPDFIGVDSFTYKALDGTNESIGTVTIQVTNTANHPPVISITSPTNNASFVVKQTITVTVNVSDEDAPGLGGTVIQVQYFKAGVSIGLSTT